MAPADTGYFVHEAGRPGRGAVLDVGLKCPHSCRFCYYSYFDGSDEQFRALRAADFRSTADCLAILDGLKAHGLNHVDLTGGEPAAHPGVAEMARAASRIGLPARLITLGQLLLRPRKTHGGSRLLDELLAAGLPDFLFSLHAASEEDFRAFTGGSLATLLATLDALDAMGFQYGLNTVVFEGNYQRLPDIARMSADRGAYIHNFIVFNAYHGWSHNQRATAVQARYTAARPYITEAVDILDRGGVAVNVRYVPLCVFPELSRHVVGVLGTSFDPFDWRNRAMCHDKPPAWCSEPLPLPESGVREAHALRPADEVLSDGTHVTAMRGERFKLFVEACGQCPARPACDGIDPDYLERHGASEFAPLAGAHAVGPLLAERLAYRAPHVVKTAPLADMRAAIAAMR